MCQVREAEELSVRKVVGSLGPVEAQAQGKVWEARKEFA